MSCCNHFRDFLVLSSADLTRLTLVDAASCPAPGCQQITKHTNYCPPVQICQTALSRNRPRIVFEAAAAGSASALNCCCFRFFLAFLLLFHRCTHRHTRNSTKTDRRSNFLVCLNLPSSFYSSLFFLTAYSKIAAAENSRPGQELLRFFLWEILGPAKKSENPENFSSKKASASAKRKPFFTQSQNDSSFFSLLSVGQTKKTGTRFPGEDKI